MSARPTDRRGATQRVPLLRTLFIVVPLLSACDSGPSPPPRAQLGEFVRHAAPPLDSLRAAAETVRVGYVSMVAQAELWFTRMPGGADGSGRAQKPPLAPLTGLVYLHRADSLPLHATAGVALQGAWLRAGDSTWALSTAQDAPGFDGIARLTHSVRGRPPWLGPNDTVYVVLRVRYPDGSSRLVVKRRVHVYVAE